MAAEFSTQEPSSSLLTWVTYNVEAILGDLIAPSVMIHNWFSGLGRVIVWPEERVDLA